MILMSGSENYNTIIKSPNRKWTVYLRSSTDGTSWSILTPKNLKSFSLSDYTSDGSNITMGCVAGGKLVVNLTNIPSPNVKTKFREGTRLVIDLRVSANNSSSRLYSDVFIIDEVKVKKLANDNCNVTLTAYDLSYTMTREYVTALANPTALEIVNEIASKYNLGISSSVATKISSLGSNLSAYTFAPLSGFTDKETLAYIAGCFGCFARINHNTEIEFEWYRKTYDSIGNDRLFANGSAWSQNRTIVMLETGTKDNPIVLPNNANGYSINFENPYITQEHALNIYNKYISSSKINFRTGKIKYKGNPVNRPGTIVDVTDYDGTSSFYVMKRTLTYDGGLSETIECQGSSETTINYKLTSPTQQKIDRLYSRMEEAIKNATDIITQTKGSVFEFIPVDEKDPSKGNSGWKLYSTAFGNQNVILANSSGIGFSSNGGQSFDAAAIYIDENGQGHINGNYITAGSISADKIDTSQIVVGGSGDYKDLEELLNGVVDTSNNSVTGVDVLYAINNSQTVAPTKPISPDDEATKGWSTNAPQWQEGMFIWTLTKTVSGNGASYSDPVCITSASGTAGADGVGILEVKNYYLASASSSGVTHETSGWTLSVQTITSDKPFLWNYEEVVYTNNDFQVTAPIVIGTLGRGIKQVWEYYGKSADYNTEPTEWSNKSVPQLDPINKYLWNKSLTEFTDGYYSDVKPRVIGVYGDTGARGEKGATGATGEKGQSVKAVVEEYCLYPDGYTPTDTYSGWSTAQPTWSEGYSIWTRSKVTWEKADGTTYTTYTTPVLAKAVNGANSTASSAQSAANTAQSTANTANTNASNALSVANTANGKIASWCHKNDTTLIDGAKIFTGSITAMQIAAGSITADKLSVGSITADKIAVGDLTNYCKVNAISYGAFGFDTIEGLYPDAAIPTTVDYMWLTPKEYKTQYYLGDWVDFSYNKDGDNKFLYQGQFYNRRSNAYAYFCVNAMLDNGVTYVFNQGTGSGDVYCYSSGVHSFSKTIALNTSYGGHRVIKIRPMIYLPNTPTSTYWFAINEVTFRRATAGDITAGKLQSVDGKTYFDLDTGDIKTTSESFNAKFNSAKLTYGWGDYDVGAIEGWVAQDTAVNRRLMVYSPNMVEFGIGSSASEANGTGVVLASDSLQVLADITSPITFNDGLDNIITMTADSSSSLKPCLQASCRVFELNHSSIPSIRFRCGTITADIYMENGLLKVADANGIRVLK